MTKDRIITWIAIVSLFMLNIVLKSIFLGVNNIDIDEPYTIYHAQGPLRELFIILERDNNPPLFFVLLHYWIKVFGVSPAAVRFLPMLFSSLAVPFIYLIGKRYYGVTVAIGASLLYTFSNLNIMEAHDTRAYGLFVLLSCISMYLYLSVLDTTKKRILLIMLTVTNILLLYTHLLGCFILIIQAGYTLFITDVRRNIFKQYLLSSIVLVLAFLPYLYLFILQRLIIKLQEGMPFEKSKPSHLYALISSFSNYNAMVTNLFLGVLFISLLVALIRWRKLSSRDVMIIGWFVFPFLLMYLISYKISITIPKYMIFITPGFYLTMAIAANTLIKKNWAGIAVTLILVFLMANTTDLKASNYEGSAEVVSTVMKNKTKDTGVILAPPWIFITFAYHHDINAFKDYGWNTYVKLYDEQILAFWSVNEFDTLNLDTFSDVIFVVGEGNGGLASFDPQQRIYNTLLNKFKTVSPIGKYTGYKIYHFGNAPAAVLSDNKRRIRK